MWNVIEKPKVSYDFDSVPAIRLYQNDRHLCHQNIDPMPAYAHKRSDIDKGIELCDRAIEIPVMIHLFYSEFEFPSRTNGWSNTGYLREGDKIWQGTIGLSGKRIPPHPAMTRYLVVHEFGHHVEFFLDRVLNGAKGPDGSTRKEYAKLRGMENPPYYGPGTWHASPGEVFANDFRIMVAGCEPEFWPHDGTSYPDGELRRKLMRFFWQPAMEEIREFKL